MKDVKRTEKTPKKNNRKTKSLLRQTPNGRTLVLEEKAQRGGGKRRTLFFIHKNVVHPRLTHDPFG